LKLALMLMLDAGAEMFDAKPSREGPRSGVRLALAMIGLFSRARVEDRKSGGSCRTLEIRNDLVLMVLSHNPNGPRTTVLAGLARFVSKGWAKVLGECTSAWSSG
jgi:hypothetical protein